MIVASGPVLSGTVSSLSTSLEVNRLGCAQGLSSYPDIQSHYRVALQEVPNGLNEKIMLVNSAHVSLTMSDFLVISELY